jgi:tetratricopeptide (TPR) repeat protein
VLKKSRIVLELALILCGASALFAADIKLRIYLQDGTLQSGNLITETDTSFVVLGKDGRAEVPKDKIMFINGKTLKQWQERPDKLFQTEILPSEIPNPAYVNDKAALPSAPAISTKPLPLPAKAAIPRNKTKTAAEPTEGRASENSALPSPDAIVAASRSTPNNATLNSNAVSTGVGATPSTPANLQSAAVANPATAAAAPVARAGRKHRRARTTDAAAAAIAPRPARPVKAEQATSAAVPSVAASARAASEPLGNDAGLPLPPHFSRKEYADVYYQRALRYIDQKQPGSALHALHIAAVLDRQNPEPVLMLGKIYFEQGLLNHARKFLNHPILKKREDAKELLHQIAITQETKKRSRYILDAATGVGALAWIPLLFLVRKIKRPARRVVTAESAIASPFPDKIAKTREDIAPVLEEILADKASPKPVPPEPAFMKPPPPPARPPAPSAPAMPSPAMPPPPPIPLPIVSKPLTPSVPPPIVPTMPAAPITEIPTSSGFVPAAASGMPDAEAVLRLASMVEQSVRKGNAFAIEEQFVPAAREYRTALALNPSCLEAYLGMAYLSFAQGQLDLALEHYARCVKIDPSSADAHYGMGRVLLENARVDEAVLEFQQTLTLDPTFDDARETLTALNTAA